ncbi:MAG: MFS transporter [Candidatus Limnocylindrales bacterium]
MNITLSPRGVRSPEAPRPRRKAKPPAERGALAVLRNRPFLLLWLAQLSTQVGGNMVIYGLTIIIFAASGSNSAVSVLLLSFLVPAILFSAMAGVFVDRVDKRQMLIVTNILRGLAFMAIFLVGNNLLMLYLLMIFVSTATTFFGPAEASLIPALVRKKQLLAANGLFLLTQNVAFALGFALLGPVVVALASAELLILIVAALYFVAAAVCWTLPSSPPVLAGSVSAGQTVADAERAVQTMVGQFVEGVAYIRDHRNVGWSLSYLGITGALVGILGVLGPGFAKTTLNLGEKDFGLIVLPLGLGIVTGILALNAYGRYLPRRRTIEGGMIGMGILLAILSLSGPISHLLQAGAETSGLQEASRLVSLLSLVMGIAFMVGAAYVIVAISAQTQLQEELPEDVRGRVFGVLNMLVSVASLAPIIIVGPVADLVGREAVILFVGGIVCLWGIAGIISHGRMPVEDTARAPSASSGAPVDPMTAAMSPSDLSSAAMPSASSGGGASGTTTRRTGRGRALEDGEAP